MPKLMVQCTYVNLDLNSQFGEDPHPIEAWTPHRGKLFRSMQQEFGRCIGLMRDEIDTDEPCGWIFQKRTQYTDTGRYGRKPEFYLQETWVRVIEVKDEPVDPAPSYHNRYLAPGSIGG